MASFIKVMQQPYPKSVLPSIKPLGDDVSSRKNVSCEKNKIKLYEWQHCGPLLTLQLILGMFERLGKSFGVVELLHGKICIIFKVSLKYFLFCIFVNFFCNDHFWTFAMKGYQDNFSIGRVKRQYFENVKNQ
jgi:hypothetical protein